MGVFLAFAARSRNAHKPAVARQPDAAGARICRPFVTVYPVLRRVLARVCAARLQHACMPRAWRPRRTASEPSRFAAPGCDGTQTTNCPGSRAPGGTRTFASFPSRRNGAHPGSIRRSRSGTLRPDLIGSPRRPPSAVGAQLPRCACARTGSRRYGACAACGNLVRIRYRASCIRRGLWGHIASVAARRPDPVAAFACPQHTIGDVPCQCLVLSGFSPRRAT